MKQKLNKGITFILIICILLSSFPSVTQAFDVLPGEKTAILTLRDAEVLKIGKPVTDEEAEDFAYIVRNNNGGTPLKNNKGTFLNVVVYKYYGIIAYGGMNGTKDIYGEWRYLGYDINGKKITNDLYKNDFPPDTTKLEEMDWVKPQGAYASWNKTSDDKIIDRIMSYNPIIDENNPISYSMSSILAKYVGEGSSNDDARKYYMFLNGIPTLASNGSVKLERKVGTSIRYNTFTIPKFDFDPTVTVTTDKPSYTIGPAETSVTAKVTVTANLEIDTDLGRTPAEALKNIYLSFEGQSKLADISGTKAVAIFDKVFKRGEGLTESETSANNVRLEGYVKSMDSLFGDKWGTDHGKPIRGETTTTLYVKPAKGPYVSITATPVPSSVKFADADIPVKINVHAELIGYSNISNIQSVVLKAGYAENDPNTYPLVTVPVSTSGTASFDFVISKSKVTSDSFDQDFNAIATFAYKTAVNGQTQTIGTTSCSVNIYKEEPIPPVPGNIKPKAKIKAPSEVKAGDEFFLDGSESSDEDGYIAEYQWALPGTGIELYGESGDIWYPDSGKHTVKLRVTDDGGARDSTTKTINVLPPTPVAKIRVLGTPKENRKITLDASESTSPMHYPITWASTLWGLSATSGNKNSDIKYNGVLNGLKTKDILVKRTGVDRVSLSVTNIKGLSDTEAVNLNIAPDKPPIADFSAVTTLFRNPEDTNFSLITINDTSYSTDNDYIDNVILTFSYDSDNNGVFNDGNIQIDASTYTHGQTKLVTTPWGFDAPVTVYKPVNKPIQFDIRTKHVGKYYADLKAIEGFGQETIPEFVTAADYRTDDTTDKPNIDKTIEVMNLAPAAGFNMTNKRKADIVIALPDNITKAAVESQLNSMVIPGLVNNNMDYNIRYVNYQTHIPQPVDNYAYFVDADHGNHEMELMQYNYQTGELETRRMTHLSDRHAEPFVTKQNVVWCKSQSSYYEGDGISVGYYRLMKYDGNNGLGATAVFTTLDEDGEAMGGDLTYITVNNEGTIFWTYKGVRYGRTVSGTSNFVVPAGSTIDEGNQYTAFLPTDFMGRTLSYTEVSINNKPNFRVLSSKNGIATTIAEFRRSIQDDGDDDEWVRLGHYYPSDSLFTIDKAFNSITWADNHERYFVTLSNRNISELTDSYVRDVIANNSIKNNVTLISMGNSTNKSQFDNLIEKNDGNGLYTEVTNLGTAFTKLSEYILNRKNVDLVFNIGQSAYSMGTIRAKVVSLMKPILAAGNISANITYINTAVDINSALDSAIWNPLNDHMFIHVQDTIIPELNDGTKRSAILEALKVNAADIVGLGKGPNSSQINSLVSANDNEGTYIDNTTIDAAVTSLGNYVVANARRKSPNIYRYVVLGEEVDYNTTYKDIENDPIHSERWKYVHNETFFENNLGRIADSGTYRAAPYRIFTKTGRYDITYAARDNPKDHNLFDSYRLWSNEDLSKATIYVHRRPVASYLWNITKTSGIYDVAITDTSEDLDHLSRTDKGIAQRQWKWKLPNDIGWQQGIPTNLQLGNTYILQLLVQDIEGAWSDPYIQELEISSLIIDGIPSYRDWANTDVNVNVITTRTGAASLKKVEYKWTNTTDKPTSGWLTNNTYSFYTAQVNNGEWYLHLVAHDNRSATVYTYKGPYRIDKIPPVITADKTSMEESNEPVEVNVNITDEGGSGIKDVKYAWSQAASKPSVGWTMTNGSFSSVQEDEGLWYLHVEAADNAGNVTYECFGTYMIETFKLEKFRIVMVRDLHLENYYYNSFTGKYDDRPMYVNSMALDEISFGNMVDGLTKGYKFEFEIDSRSFNDNTDTIIIEPHFFTTDGFARDGAERDLYWEDSKHQIFKVGEGGHREWKTITLDASNRTIKSDNEAIWRGEYLIPGSSWAVEKGTAKAQAKSRNLKRDIVVNFHIMGYKDGILQFDYNAEQWGLERTSEKYPYIIGDVIRYSWNKNCLDDIIAKDNR